MMAILDEQAVIIHGQSVKELEQVVCYENANETSSWILTPKRRNAIWCQLESAMFCAHLSYFVCCTIAYRTCDEEMSKPLLVLTLLKIISNINRISVYRFRITIDSI